MMKVNTVPVPSSGTHASSSLRQLAQKRTGGMRKVPQLAHFGASRRSSFAAVQYGWVRSSAIGSVIIGGGGMFLNGLAAGSVAVIYAFLTIVALIGIADGPPVKSASSHPSTWFTAVPRTCSTASYTCVNPMT